jgi:imidazolonepropionase-like amidohydrolase
MAVLRVRGIGLPDGETIDLFADGDRWTSDPVGGAELAGEGWVLPGLVDMHTHPGAENPGDPLDERLLHSDLEAHLAAGVTMIRSPGLADDPPPWFGVDPDLPRAVHAGRWIAQQGQFFDGWAHRVDHADLPATAAEQARRTGWVKLIADWGPDDPALPIEVLQRVVVAVHAVGGRVAVHSQQADGGRAAVSAGVDSLEHGMWLDPSLLPQMAARGTALTPTLAVLIGSMAEVARRPESARRQWYLEGAGAHGALVAAAAESGVTLLAGTDSRPHGRVSDEVRALAAAGVPASVALGSASWTARAFLGVGGLQAGAPADAVVYAADPRKDLGQLASPKAVVLRGRLIRTTL